MHYIYPGNIELCTQCNTWCLVQRLQLSYLELPLLVKPIAHAGPANIPFVAVERAKTCTQELQCFGRLTIVLGDVDVIKQPTKTPQNIRCDRRVPCDDGNERTLKVAFLAARVLLVASEAVCEATITDTALED